MVKRNKKLDVEIKKIEEECAKKDSGTRRKKLEKCTVEENDEDDLISSGTKRKLSCTKRTLIQSDKVYKKTTKQDRRQVNNNDSDSDFEQQKVVKIPKRKFTSVPNGVKPITSYFSLTLNEPSDSNECVDSHPQASTNVMEVIEEKVPEELMGRKASVDVEIIEEEALNESSGTRSSDDKVEVNTEKIKDVANDKRIEAVCPTNDIPTRRRSGRIQSIEERKKGELVEKRRSLISAKLPRICKRMQIVDSDSEEAIAIESELDGDESSDFIADSDDEEFQKKRNRKRKSKNVIGKISLMFLTGKERELELLRLQKEKDKKQNLDAETLAFLHSGVPDVVLKAQKQAEKRVENEELLNIVEFFPKISHIGRENDNMVDVSNAVLLNGLTLKELPESQVPLGCSWKEVVLFNSSIKTLNDGMLCCGNIPFSHLNNVILNMETHVTPDKDECSEMPWLEKLRVLDKKELVIDKEAFSRLEKWLIQWKTDIKDDGGTSRKEIRRRRKDVDSDFVTSDEDDREFMNKSVLLCGSTGCGKTAAVYVVAKHLGFYVVEVNFSSRRSGKEVIQRVEEATLSHRLKSSESCLLLFKDIDLIHPDEDGGFHAAVAQLIGASCRPIVMTTQQEMYSPLDPKIEKKDPLRIYFDRPASSKIVKNILLPMCKSSVLDPSELDEKRLSSGLDCLVRHVQCDIRLSINQAQFLCYGNFFTFQNVHKHCNLTENPVDLHFTCKTKEMINCAGESKIGKNKVLYDLDKISKDLSFLFDMELISSQLKNCQDYCSEITSSISTNFLEHVRRSCIRKLWNQDSSIGNCGSMGKEIVDFQEELVQCYRKLTFFNDADELLNREVGILNEELENYCDIAFDWQTCGFIRTIVKTSTMNSIGRAAKRNGRMACYFNRLDRQFVNRINGTFGFAQELERESNN